MTGAASLPALVLASLIAATALAVTDVRARTRADLVRHRLAGDAAPGGVPAWFVAGLRSIEFDGDPARAWPVVRALGLAVGCSAVAARPGVAVAVGLAVGAAALVAPVLARRRAAVAFEAGLPSAVEAIAGRVAAGRSLRQAIEGAAVEVRPPVADDLTDLGVRQARGSSLQAAVDHWVEQRAGTGVGLVADALALAGTSGGSQARALAGVADTLRERQALAREVRALGSQARASAVVLVVLPVAFSAVVALLDPRVAHVLVGTPIGWGCLAVGALLDGVGAWWMSRLLGAAS